MGYPVPLCAALFLLVPLLAWGETYHVSQLEARRHGRTVPRGSDSHSCDQARNPATARATVNAGIACLAPGDTLMIGPGTYNELLISQTSSSRACSSGDAAVQQPCAPIPNGLDPDRPTRLIGDGRAVLSPAGKQLPGGGSAITLLDYARYVHIEGLRVVKHAAAGSTGGIYTGNVQHVTITRNELDNGQIKGGVTSRYLSVTHNHIHHAAAGCMPPEQKPEPSKCHHGMYICGTDHVISDNLVEYGAYYGIQVSCEQGGIARIRLERNTVQYNAGVGIRCGGSDCLIGANLLRSNGQGITVSGSGTITHNTIDGWQEAPWNDDPGAIWDTQGDGRGFQITNNLITHQKNPFSLIGNTHNLPPDPSTAHHNMCDVSGNTGCPLLADAAVLYTSSQTGDYTLAASSPARGAGVSAPVEADLLGHPYPTPPDLGAYAWRGTPVPPEPEPVPPGALTLACTGTVQAVPGPVQMTCTQQVEGRR